MAVYTDAMKTARMQIVLDAIDAAATPATLEFGTAGMATVLATFTLQKPSATLSGDTLTFGGFPTFAIAVTTGVVDEARIRDGDGNDVVTEMTVGTTSAADVVMLDTSVNIGQAIFVKSARIIHG